MLMKFSGQMMTCGQQLTHKHCCAPIGHRRFASHIGLCFLSVTLKPRSHCADHSLPMFPIIADRPDLS